MLSWMFSPSSLKQQSADRHVTPLDTLFWFCANQSLLFLLNAWKMWFHLVCRCILPLCSIYSNSSHVGWLVGSSDTSVKVDIQANFDWNKQCFTEDLNSLCWLDGHRQKVMTKAQITLFELKSKYIILFFMFTFFIFYFIQHPIVKIVAKTVSQLIMKY